MPRQHHQEQKSRGEGSGKRNAALCIWLFVAVCLLVGCGYKTRPRPATETIPGEVGLLDARSYPDRVVLRWDAPIVNTDGSTLNDISGFKVWRLDQKIGEECENCDEKKTLHANIDFQKPSNAMIEKGEIIYTDTAVETGNTYTYSVSAYNFKGKEAPPSQDVTVVMEEPPPAPENVRVDFDSRGTVLEWEAPVRPSGIKGYRIYRDESGSSKDMKPIGGTKWAETNFLDKDVEKEKTYYYEVRSIKTNRGIPVESVPSQIVKIVVPAVRWQPPENVNVMPKRDRMSVYWTPVKIEGQETRYNLYRSESGKAFAKVNKEALRNPWYNDSEVGRGKTYRYAVTAFPETKPYEESSRSASEAVKLRP